MRQSKRPCLAAVGYAGQGASALLPLPPRSTLVVDASEAAVKAGQTDPNALLRLIRRGVRVFSKAGLHAKVFVAGRRAFIGSNNASRHSADHLIEAAVVTSHAPTVDSARRFIRTHTTRQLTPVQTERLIKLHRPPQIAGGRGRGRRTEAERGPRLHLVQLVEEDLAEEVRAELDRQLERARTKRKHPRAYQVDSFVVNDPCGYQEHDIVIQVLKASSTKRLITAPGNIIHTKSLRSGRGRITFVYVERPRTRQRNVRSIAKRVGRGSLRKLMRDGEVRNRRFAEQLLEAWHSRG